MWGISLCRIDGMKKLNITPNAENNQQGVILLELLTSLPAIAGILCSAVIFMALVLKLYSTALGGWELMEQMRFTAQILSEDISSADEVWVSKKGARPPYISVIKKLSDGTKRSVQYLWRDAVNSRNSAILRDGQPIAGNNSIGTVDLTDFKVYKEPTGNGLVYICISGINRADSENMVVETMVKSNGPVYIQ